MTLVDTLVDAPYIKILMFNLPDPGNVMKTKTLETPNEKKIERRIADVAD